MLLIHYRNVGTETSEFLGLQKSFKALYLTLVDIISGEHLADIVDNIAVNIYYGKFWRDNV